MVPIRPQRPGTRADFEIGIICALRIESDAVNALFDHRWRDEGITYGKQPNDTNAYTPGVIGCHNVVLAHMPNIGKISATTVAIHLRMSFPNIKLALVVGVCGVVPFYPHDGKMVEIVLGDVIVSDGIVQYDLGQQLPGRFKTRDIYTDILPRPSAEIRSLLGLLQGSHDRNMLRKEMAGYINVFQGELDPEATYPGTTQDRLFEATYRHIRDGISCEECARKGKLVSRTRLEQGDRRPAVHFGRIASGDTVMKSGEDRDLIARLQPGVIGFEMEGAGVWDTFPCVVIIKGACDYADSHKTKAWQRYAAATAAACMKAFLGYWEHSMLGAGWKRVQRRKRPSPAPPSRIPIPSYRREAASHLHPRIGKSDNSYRPSRGNRGQLSVRSRPSSPIIVRPEPSSRTARDNGPRLQTLSRPHSPSVRSDGGFSRISRDDRRYTPKRPWTRGLLTYCISNLEFTLRDAEIHASLQNFEIESIRGGKVVADIRSRAPAAMDRQTVVVTFKQQLLLDDDDQPRKLTKFRTTGQLVPAIDQMFEGITPLSSPWDDRKTLKQAAESESKLAPYLNYLVSLFHSSSSRALPSLPIKVDIIIITPPGEHPFCFWKSGINDLGSEPMWVVDWLKNEGFDGARISVFNIDETRGDQGQECLGIIAKYVEDSQLGPDHPVVVVEFLRRAQRQSIAREMCVLQSKKKPGPRPRQAQLRAIVFEEMEEAPVPDEISLPPCPYCTAQFWLTSASSDDEPLRFSSNDNDIYRNLVDSIWTNLDEIYEASPSTTRSPRQAIEAPLGLFNELIKPLDDYCTVFTKTAKGNNAGNLEHDEIFYAIINNQDFVAWRDPDSDLNALRICGPQDLRLGELCARLPSALNDYDVLRIDCAALAQACNKMEGYGKANSLVGPLLLQIFRFIVASWARKCGNAKDEGAMATTTLTDLAEGIIEGEGSNSNVRDPMGSLVYGIERLGSNVVQAMSHALRRGKQMQTPATESAKSMILFSSLHAFEESPELGRLVHCARKLHQSIVDLGGVCKILFTHEDCQHLKGLLRGVTEIDSHEEFHHCLTSLQRTHGSNTKTIDDRHAGTLEWVGEDKDFKEWRDEGGSALLLLVGKPASGKSVISQFAIEELRGEYPKKKKKAAPAESRLPEQEAIGATLFTTYFFHADGSDEFNTSTAMLQELLYNMLRENPLFFPHFQRQFRKLKLRGQQQGGVPTWEERDLTDVLEALRDYGLRERIVVVVDGLDESQDLCQCAKVLAKLVAISKGGYLSVKLLVATRRDGEIQGALIRPLKKQGISSRTIILEDKNRTDIIHYSSAVLAVLAEGDTERERWTANKIDRAAHIMAKMSDGIFLWPKLATVLIKDFLVGNRRANIQELKTFLGKINPDIENLYQRLLDRLLQGPLDPRKADRSPALESLRMFHIVMQAKRQLSSDEFQDVFILVENQEPRGAVMDDLRITNMDVHIANITANFLEVNKKRGTVNFVHSTASRFLHIKLQDHGLQSAAFQPSGPIGCGGLSIMEHACIWYLHKASIDLEGLSISWAAQKPTAPSPDQKPLVEAMNRFAEVINDYPLLAYAFEHGLSHLSNNSPALADAMKRLLESLGTNPMQFLLPEWIRPRLPVPPTPEDSKAFRDSVLHCAASRCSATAARVALAAGADFRSQSKLHRSGEIPICLAIMASRYETADVVCQTVQVLLKDRASANAPTRWKGTPLHYAGKYKLEGVVKQLLAENAIVNARDFQGMTPLHRTVIGLSKRLPTLDIGDDDDVGAGDEGNEGYVDEYEGDGDANDNDEHDNNPWSAQPQPDAKSGQPGSGSKEQQVEMRPNGKIAREASVQCVELLLKGGADPRAADKRGRKPIHWAAGLRDRTEIVEALLDAVRRRGVDAAQAADERCVESGSTPLQWASGYGNIDVVEFLLKQGANAGATDDRGKTAISWAARFGHDKVLTALLVSIPEGDRKAAVNRQETASQRHALIWACKKGHIECVKQLVNAGANVNLPERGYNDVGGTALSWAITTRHVEIVKYLVSNGAICDEGERQRPALGWAASTGDVNLFDTLYFTSRNNHCWLDLNQKDGKGCTPMMLAAAQGHLNMVKHLQKAHGVHMFASDCENNQALHLAASWGHKDVVEWLAETELVKMDKSRRNKNGDTPLHRAARYGRWEVMDLLLQLGAERGVQNNDGDTYKDLAKEYQERNKGRVIGCGNQDGGPSSTW